MTSLSFTHFSSRASIPFAVIICLTLSTVFSYWSVTDHGFSLYDDPAYVVSNYFLQPGVTWENVLWAMTSGYEGNWQPVTWISHMIDVQVFGMNPAGHHWDNVFIHLLGSIVLYLALRRMTKREGPSAFVAFVYALHPLHVESVAWICERKDVLAGLFGFLAIWAYSRYVSTPTVWRYVVVILFFALGLMSKPIIVTLPCVLLLLDYWPLNRTMLLQTAGERKQTISYLLVEKVPLLLMSIGSSIVTYIVQQDVGAIKANVSLGTRLANSLVSYGVYLRKTFWPNDLAIFYPYPENPWPISAVVISGIVILGLSALAFMRAKRVPWFVVGWCWFLGTLVPMIGIIHIGAKSYADRYMYWPITGVAIIIAWFVADIRISSRAVSYAKSAIAVLVCTLMAWSTVKYVGYWKDDKTLFGRALEVTERNWLAHYMVGFSAMQERDTATARVHLEQSLAIFPGAPAHFQLGQLLLKTGDAEASIPHFQYALAHNREVERAQLNLAIAFATLGRLEEAAEQLQTAYVLNQNIGRPYHNLGLILAGLQRFDDAERSLLEELRLMPGDSVVTADLERVRQLKTGQ